MPALDYAASLSSIALQMSQYMEEIAEEPSASSHPFFNLRLRSTYWFDRIGKAPGTGSYDDRIDRWISKALEKGLPMADKHELLKDYLAFATQEKREALNLSQGEHTRR
jgi:hypothetical protein